MVLWKSEIFSFPFKNFLSFNQSHKSSFIIFSQTLRTLLVTDTERKTFSPPTPELSTWLAFTFPQTWFSLSRHRHWLKQYRDWSFFNKRKHFVALFSFSTNYYCTLTVYPFSDASRKGVPSHSLKHPEKGKILYASWFKVISLLLRSDAE